MPFTLDATFGGRGQAPLRFLLPAAVATLGAGRGGTTVAVVEAGNHRVQLMQPTGASARTIAGPGGRYGLRYPMGIASDADGHSVVVADTFNHRLLRLGTSDGAVLANNSIWQQSFGHAQHPLRHPKGLCMLQHRWGSHGILDMLFVADAGNNHVCTYALAPLAAVGSTVSLPGQPAPVGHGRIVPMICFGGRTGAPTDPTAMSHPTAVAAANVAGSTRVYVADTNRDRVQVPVPVPVPVPCALCRCLCLCLCLCPVPVPVPVQSRSGAGARRGMLCGWCMRMHPTPTVTVSSTGLELAPSSRSHLGRVRFTGVGVRSELDSVCARQQPAILRPVPQASLPPLSYPLSLPYSLPQPTVAAPLPTSQSLRPPPKYPTALSHLVHHACDCAL